MLNDAFGEIGETIPSEEIGTGSALGPAYAAALDAFRSLSTDAEGLVSRLPPPAGVDRIRLNSGETVFFGFILSTDANALVDKVDQHTYAAAMFAGLPVLLRGMLTECVCNEAFPHSERTPSAAQALEFEGTPITEEYLRDLGAIGHWSPERQKSYREAIAKLDDQLNPAQKSARDILTFTALKYVWLHELGHIAFGHCDYRNRHSAGPMFEHDMVSSHPAAMSDTAVLRMFMETQADDFAAYELLKEPVAALLVQAIDGEDRELHSRYLLDHFLAAVLASYCLFMIRVLKTGTWSKEVAGVPFVDLLGAGSYPPDQVRALTPLWGAGKVFADFRNANGSHEAVITETMQKFTRRALDGLEAIASGVDAFALYRSFFSTKVFNSTYEWTMINHFGDRVDTVAESLKPFFKWNLLSQAGIDTVLGHDT